VSDKLKELEKEQILEVLDFIESHPPFMGMESKPGTLPMWKM